MESDDYQLKIPESPKQALKKSETGATLPPLTSSFDGSYKGLQGLMSSPKGSKGTPRKRRSGSFDRHSSERKKLPKPSENPTIMHEKFVGNSFVQADSELHSYAESRSKDDEDQFDRDSDNELERLLNEKSIR
jgi:hypothetical protein